MTTTYFPEGVFNIIKDYANIKSIHKQRREKLDNMLPKLFRLIQENEDEEYVVVSDYTDYEKLITRGIGCDGQPEYGYDATY